MLSYRHGRHRNLRWIGLVCSLFLLVALFVATFGWAVLQHEGYVGGLFRGCLSAKSPPDPNNIQREPRTLSIGWRPRGTPLSMNWWPRFVLTGKGMWKITLPLWIPTLVVLVPTVVLWATDRRHPPDHCQTCGYNLTGNESGVCPECGTRVSR